MTARVLAAVVTTLGFIALAALLIELRVFLREALDGREVSWLALAMPFLVALGTALSLSLAWAGTAAFLLTLPILGLYLIEEGPGAAALVALAAILICAGLGPSLARAQAGN